MTETINLPGPHGIQPLPSTVGTAEARAQRIRLGIVNYTQLLKDIADAYAQRDWATLGYQTWDAYVTAEFGEQRLQLDRARRERAVSELRSAGLSTRAISSALGVPQTTVRRDLDSGEPNGSPAEVGGADGKQYPATQPKPAPEYVKPIDSRQPAASPPAGGDAGAVGSAAVEPPAAPVAGGSAPQPMPQPTPEALERHARERAEQTSREVASRNFARSIWFLAQSAEVNFDAVEHLISRWEPSQDIYPKPTTAERIRHAADYLHALAERWPQ